MIERVDQLVLEYVSRAADAAHGVLPPRQRIDFVGRLRKRIDAERMGMDSPAAVEKVLAQFGDPVVLVRREVHRLNSETTLGGLAETLEEAERPTGVIVPAPASGLHDSSEPLSGRSVTGDHAAPESATADSAMTGSVAGSAFSEPIPPGEDDLESPGSGRSDMTIFGASTSDRSGEAGFEWADSREPGAPRRSHPYGDVPGGSVPPPRDSGTGSESPAAHEAASADAPGDAPSGVPEPTARPRSSSVAPGGGEPDDPAAERVEADDPPTEEIPPARGTGAQPEAAPVPAPESERESPSRAETGSGSGPGPEPGPASGSEPTPGRGAKPGPGSGPGPGEGGAAGDERPRAVIPPGVAKARREAEELLARRQARKRPGLLRRPSRAPRSREDVVAGESDVRSVLLGHRREVIGMALLGLAGLLVPFPFAPIAIFRIPVLVWAVAVLVVTVCEAWEGADKVRGAAAPILSYTIGGCLVALIRSRNDLSLVVDQFFEISGLMFMLGSAAGVFWLAYRLFNPVPPVGRRNRSTTPS
ncbi:hypothetical protein DKM19_43940 [Streptosporangium sp. 'caverna']|nr:hypothetical protein DKM19_43940 [Streptosporangium sp. 'caverna']